MILAAMLGYYVFAIGLLALIGYLACRKNAHELRVTTDAAIARLRTAATPHHASTATDDPTPEHARTSPADTTLQHEYAAAVTGLRAVLRKMASAGMGVTPDRVTADVTTGDALK